LSFASNFTLNLSICRIRFAPRRVCVAAAQNSDDHPNQGHGHHDKCKTQRWDQELLATLTINSRSACDLGHDA